MKCLGACSNPSVIQVSVAQKLFPDAPCLMGTLAESYALILHFHDGTWQDTGGLQLHYAMLFYAEIYDHEEQSSEARLEGGKKNLVFFGGTSYFPAF